MFFYWKGNKICDYNVASFSHDASCGYSQLTAMMLVLLSFKHKQLLQVTRSIIFTGAWRKSEHARKPPLYLFVIVA